LFYTVEAERGIAAAELRLVSPTAK
jgi:hypothetical protein